MINLNVKQKHEQPKPTDDGRPTTGHRQLKNGHKIITRLNFQTKREAKNYDET